MNKVHLTTLAAKALKHKRAFGASAVSTTETNFESGV